MRPGLQYDFAQTTRRALGSPVKIHLPGSAIVQRNDANGDFEVALDLFFDFTRPVPMRERKTAMDLRFRRILRREEIVEISFLIRSYACLRRETSSLADTSDFWIEPRISGTRATNSSIGINSFAFTGLIAPADCDGIFLQIARADLDAQSARLF